MRFRLCLAVALCAGVAVPAIAGQGAPADGAIATATPGVDLARLPVNIGRISRQMRQADVREQRDGLKLHYTIDVFGETPRIKFITPLDNILTGTVPRTAPSHNEMIRMMTPLEFSAPVMNLGSLPKRK